MAWTGAPGEGPGPSGGHLSGPAGSPWAPDAVTVAPATGFAGQERRFGVGDDPSALPASWDWIHGQLVWAATRFANLRINPSWFSDNSKGMYKPHAGEPGAGIAYPAINFYNTLYGHDANDFLLSTHDRGKSGTDAPSQFTYLYAPEVAEETEIPATWVRMTPGQRVDFASHANGHSDYLSQSLCDFEGDFAVVIKQLFQTSIGMSDHLQQATKATVDGYAQTDQSMQQTWQRSTASLAQQYRNV